MTLYASLLEHFISQPEVLTSVKVNGCVTTDYHLELVKGDVVEVDWPNVGIRRWVVGGPATCGYQPADTRYAPCTRDAGHEGPCAHDFA